MTNLNIIELFSSVQGETSWSGIPTFFIRTAACNLRCSWCDTPYSFGRGSPIQLSTIIDKVNESGCRHVCITGGEPLLHSEVHELMRYLADLGYKISLETGGSLPIRSIDPRVKVVLDIKCPGSGMSHKNLLGNLTFLKSLDEVKFVILDRADYVFAKNICEKHNLWAYEVLFSPVHGKMDPKDLVKWILEDKLAVRLNLQIHKFIWSPETIGV